MLLYRGFQVAWYKNGMYQILNSNLPPKYKHVWILIAFFGAKQPENLCIRPRALPLAQTGSGGCAQSTVLETREIMAMWLICTSNIHVRIGGN